MLKSQSRCQPSLNDSHENLRYRLPQSFIHGMRTICSELCRFLVAMILSSLPPHNAPGVARRATVRRLWVARRATSPPASAQADRCAVVGLLPWLAEVTSVASIIEVYRSHCSMPG